MTGNGRRQSHQDSWPCGEPAVTSPTHVTATGSGPGASRCGHGATTVRPWGDHGTATGDQGTATGRPRDDQGTVRHGMATVRPRDGHTASRCDHGANFGSVSEADAEPAIGGRKPQRGVDTPLPTDESAAVPARRLIRKISQSRPPPPLTGLIRLGKETHRPVSVPALGSGTRGRWDPPFCVPGAGAVTESSRAGPDRERLH